MTQNQMKSNYLPILDPLMPHTLSKSIICTCLSGNFYL